MSDKHEDAVVIYDEPQSQSLVEQINSTLNRELKSPETVRALLATTFQGLDMTLMKQALMEGMIRGFTFKDFLQKDVYAIPFANKYSLVTSIEHARKRGMRGGVIGKSAPQYVSKENGDIDSCTITIKRLVNKHIGEFTQTVFFDEYTTGRNLWKTKPKTMIAKVAEMHALRMACPDELAHVYVEEEFDSESTKQSRYSEAKDLSSGLKMSNYSHDANQNSQEENNEESEEAENKANSTSSNKAKQS